MWYIVLGKIAPQIIIFKYCIKLNIFYKLSSLIIIYTHAHFYSGDGFSHFISHSIRFFSSNFISFALTFFELSIFIFALKNRS